MRRSNARRMRAEYPPGTRDFRDIQEIDQVAARNEGRLRVPYHHLRLPDERPTTPERAGGHAGP